MKKHPKIISEIAPEYLVGIDEAGRGPLAGPVAVGTVKIAKTFNTKFFKGIKDSKQLNEDERNAWFRSAKIAQGNGELDFAVTLISHTIIDKHGMTKAVQKGIKQNLLKLKVHPKKSHIYLDGLLKAPIEFEQQITVIKGDEKIPVISLASIVAKVTRDKFMKNIAKKYPEYGFDRHKGYGTLEHRKAILKHGKTPIHRVSFLGRLLSE
ncbi:MAG: ribonuclease HII [Minisyncoccia bacterium]